MNDVVDVNSLATIQARQLNQTLTRVNIQRYTEFLKDIQCRLGILIEKLTSIENDNNKQSTGDINEEKVKDVCEKMLHDSVHDSEWYVLRVLSAHIREIAEKDAEIASLKAKCDEYERQPELMAETAKKALELIKSHVARIALLEKALKPVIEINLEWLTKFEGIDYEELLTAIVADAQRIMKEGENNG